jgi:FKBP-type peptidyl-prolyl cis-transisomerase
MNISFEKIGDVAGKLTVNVEENDYKAKVNAELKKIGATHNIPGFRKGHINIDQLRRRFGKDVMSDVINETVYHAVIDYIKENKINILGQPLPEKVVAVNMDQKDYTFAYEVGLAPELNIEVDKNVTLPYYTIDITDQMLEDQDKSLRERFGAQVPGEEVDNKAVIKGTIMELNADGTVKESEDAIQVINGIVAPFYFKNKEEEQKFIGKKLNDKVVFNPYNSCEGNVAELSSMLNIDKDKAADVKGDFEMVITEIIVVKPAEHNQEFFDNVFGRDKVHNDEEYNQALKEMISNSFRGTTDYYFNTITRDYFVDKYGADMKLPEDFLIKWLTYTNPEAAKDADMKKEYAEMLPSLKWQIISDRIADQLKVSIDNDDVLARAKFIARQQFNQYGIYNIDEETVTDTAKRILADKNYSRRIAEEVSELKLFAVIREAITIDLKTVSFEEFSKMINPAAE